VLFDPNHPHAFGVTVNPSDPRRIAVATGDDPFHDKTHATGVWISADDGATWSQANDGIGMLRGQCITFNPHNPEQLVYGSFGGGFYVGAWPASFRPTGTRQYVQTAADSATLAQAGQVEAASGGPRPLLKNGNFEQGDTTP
jgi:hypothetical protein